MLGPRSWALISPSCSPAACLSVGLSGLRFLPCAGWDSVHPKLPPALRVEASEAGHQDVGEELRLLKGREEETELVQQLRGRRTNGQTWSCHPVSKVPWTGLHRHAPGQRSHRAWVPEAGCHPAHGEPGSLGPCRFCGQGSGKRFWTIQALERNQFYAVEAHGGSSSRGSPGWHWPRVRS